MSTQITTAFVQQYSKTCQLVVQQLESHFMDKVQVERLVGEKGFFDFVGEVTMQEKLTRHSQVTYSDTPHTRRRVEASYYFNADLLDSDDKVRILADVGGKYMQAFRAGAKRKIDDLIFAAARGTAYTGKTGSTGVALPSGQKIVHGSQGMTADKLKNALQIFLTNDLDPDIPKFCTLTPADVRDLLNDPEVTSADYNMLRPLMSGQISQWMGFTFVPTNRVLTSSSISYNVAWARDGICLAIAENIKEWVRVNYDYHGATEYYIGMDLGAARMQEDLVVEIQTYHA